MTDVIKVLLKNGIMEMINENEDYFKENIAQSLAFKLNNAINDVRHEVQKNLFVEEQTTPNSDKLEYFLSFIESFEPGNFTFQDGSSINITEEDMKEVIGLFEQLAPETRQLMVSDLFETTANFKNTVQFAKNTKGLINEK